MAVKMSSADEALIAKYKQDWANATTQAERDTAHANAEAVRAGYGYSGGTDGSGYIVTGQPKAQSNADTVKASKPSGFSGSATGVDVNTDDQQAVKDAMNANSQAWWTAQAAGNQAEMDRLHAENEYYGSLLGGSVGYDAASGTWSGEAEAAPVKQKMAAATPDLDLTGMVVDHSSYLEQLYAAKKAKALAELQAAYEQNVNAINRAGQGLEEQYQNARNQTAGASELAKRNFAQYAAANGLNSGAGGQAELARNVALQNDLNSINTTEAQSFADIQLQRANAETNYNNAIAQAEAEGNYQLAAALYQEKVRVQNAMMEAAVQERQSAFQQQQYTDSLAQIQNDRLADFGTAYLENGIMPSDEMLNAMGMTQSAAQTYLDMLFPSSVSTPVVDSGTPSISYNNGGLTADQVKALQAALGVNQDGYYGPASQSAAGGLSAGDAYNKYVGGAGYSTTVSTGMKASEWNLVLNNIKANLRTGNAAAAVQYLDMVYPNMSAAQRAEVQALALQYGYQYEPEV